MNTPDAPPSGQLLGYARISTTQQSLTQQQDALRKAGCDRVFADTMSGARDDRPELAALLSYARPGDAVMVVALDRLGRTLAGIFRTVDELAARGVHVVTQREGIDTRTAIGRLFLAFFGGIAEYERTLIMERSAAARQAARDRGIPVGRPAALSVEQIALARRMRASGESVRTIRAALGCARSTLYRALAE